MGCAEFERTKFESEAQFGWCHISIDSQQLVEGGLPIPRAQTIANVEIIPQRLATQVNGRNPKTVAAVSAETKGLPRLSFLGCVA